MRPRLVAAVLGGLFACATSASAARPEVVVVALLTEERPTSEGIDAWKVVQREIKKHRRRLRISLKLQKELHDFLIGPAREQVADCGDDVECLREVGATLGTAVLVVGMVTPSAVSLRAVDAKTGRVLAQAISQRKAKTKTRAKKAAAQLVRRLRKNMKLLGKPLPAPPPPAVAVAEPPPPSDVIATPPPEATTPPPVATVASKPTADARQGSLRIAAPDLAGVKEVKIDGSVAPFSGDGWLTWTGEAGVVRLLAIRGDGSELSRSVSILQGEVVDVFLDFPNALPPTTAVASVSEEEESVTGKWWFWTAIGAAVAAGATTAAVMAAGDKGGPVVPDETGSVRGTY